MKLTKKDKELIFELLNWGIECLGSSKYKDPRLKQLYETYVKFRIEIKGI